MHKRTLFAALVAAAAVVCPAQATVTSTASSVSYTGNGSATSFTVTYKFQKNGDLVVAVGGVIKSLGPDYAVTGAGNSTGTVTFTAAPGNGVAVVISRLVDYKQETSLRGSRSYDPATVEDALDRDAMRSQQLANGVVVNQVITDVSSAAVTSSGASNSITVASALSAVTNVRAFGAVGDGSTPDASSINSALSAKTGVIYLPPSSTCYNLGGSTLSIGSGRTLEGGGMGGASAGPSCVVYTGTGCAILLDSVSFAGVRNLDVQVNSASATAAGICIKSSSAVAEFIKIENVSIRQTNATRRVAGQVGLLLTDNGAHGVFWNSGQRLRLAYWDVSIKLVGSVTNGTNANDFHDVMSWGHVTALTTSTALVVDNRFIGFHCSRSDGTWAGTATCVALVAAGFNEFVHVVSDQAAPSVCFTLDATSDGNDVVADCESGGPVVDSNATGFPNRIYEPIAGATPGRLTLGRINLTTELDMGTNPATTGDFRIANNRLFAWRNAANSGNITGIYIDTNDREKLGSSAAFLRLDNSIVEHGGGTVASSGNERYAHNWTNFGRDSTNSTNRTLWSWGATTDTLTIGDASAAAVVAAPSTFSSTQNSGTCTLNAASPAVCTATVPAGSRCAANPIGTTAAAATHTLATSVTSTTLTVTGANGLSDPVAYHCF